MNKKELLEEGEKWVEDGIITEAQLQQIASRYKQSQSNFIFIFFAVLFISIGVLIYVFTNVSDANFTFRLIIITLFMAALYGFGAYFIQKKENLFGYSFLILGYIFFGATLFLFERHYIFHPSADWLFVIWSLAGLLLLFFYRHEAILIVGLAVSIYGQMTHLFDLDVSLILLIIYAAGYFHFVYHEQFKISNWIYPIGLAIHLFIYVSTITEGFYLSFSVALVLLILAMVLPKEKIRFAFTFVSFTTLYIVNLIESFMLQNDYVHFEVQFDWIMIVLIILTALYIAIAFFTKHYLWMINLLLIIPLAQIGGGYLLSIMIMFAVALTWLIYSYRSRHDMIAPSIIIFIIATLAAYIQIGWDSMNRALFFLIGGILLFIISFILEWQRRKVEKSEHDES